MSDLPRDLAMEELLRHREWAVGLARRLLRDHARADDAVQQAMLAALESPPEHLDAPRSWLGTVVRSWVARGERSRGRRERHERVVARPEPVRGTEDAVERADLQEFLAAALIHLGEPYRTTLLLRYFDGLTLQEVADRTGTPLETVRTRIRRGLSRLRERLGDRAFAPGRNGRAPLALLLVPGPSAEGTPHSEATGSSPHVRTTLVAAGIVAAAIVGAFVASSSGSAAETAVDPAASASVSVGIGPPSAATASAPRDVPAPAGYRAHAVGPATPEAEVADADVSRAGGADARSEPVSWSVSSSAVTSLAFTPDGKALVAGGSDGSVSILAAPRGEVARTLSGHGDEVTCVAVSPDGTLVLSGSLDRTVRVWDPQRGSEVLTFRGHEAAVREVTCTATGVAASSDVGGAVLVWRLSDGAVLERLSTPSVSDYARSLSFSPDGAHLAAATRTWDGVVVWTLPVRGGPTLVRAPEGVGRACRIDAEGAGVWTLSREGLVLAALDGAVIRRVAANDGELTALALVPGHGTVLGGSRDGVVQAFGPDAAAARWTLHLPEPGVVALAVRADGTLAAAVSSVGRITLFDPGTGAPSAASERAARTQTR